MNLRGAWSACEVRLKEGDRQRLLSDVSSLLYDLETEYQVMQVARRSQFPRRPNVATMADVMEMFAGTMPFTRGAAAAGLLSLEPQDLWNGWDYHRAWDVERTFELVTAHRPRIIVAGVECTPWCWFNVYVNYKHRPKELQNMQERSAVLITMCLKLFEQQLLRGDELFFGEPGSQLALQASRRTSYPRFAHHPAQ